MILKNFKNTLIMSETESEFQKHWFDLKDKKVVHNIDTLYVTADVTGDYNTLAIPMIEFLENNKDSIDFEPVYIDKYDLFITNLSFVHYKYCLEKKDKFLIFFARKKSTDNTPPVFIQIRSQALWLQKEHAILNEVHECLSSFLMDFRLEVSKYKENRIDFAYHTNYVRNMTSFFDNLNAKQVSRFKRWSKQGTFVGDEDTETDYISIGRRTSNNVFIRIYNKTKEVIEQGYKQFFIEFWREQGLISNYDKWLYEKCFLDKNYEKMQMYRLEFYKQYGVSRVEEVSLFLEDIKNREYDEIKRLADQLTPSPTLIMNVEFQTKRKFFSSFGDLTKLVGLKNITPIKYGNLQEIYLLLDNKILIHNVLTDDVFRMVDDKAENTRKRNKPITPFWKMIQECPMGYRTDDKLLRSYQRNLDIEAIKKRLINSISTFSLYTELENEKDVISDVMSFMNYINESDVQKALTYKMKKATDLSSKLETLSKLERDKRFALVDRSTGDYID